MLKSITASRVPHERSRRFITSSIHSPALSCITRACLSCRIKHISRGTESRYSQRKRGHCRLLQAELLSIDLSTLIGDVIAVGEGRNALLGQQCKRSCGRGELKLHDGRDRVRQAADFAGWLSSYVNQAPVDNRPISHGDGIGIGKTPDRMPGGVCACKVF